MRTAGKSASGAKDVQMPRTEQRSERALPRAAGETRAGAALRRDARMQCARAQHACLSRIEWHGLAPARRDAPGSFCSVGGDSEELGWLPMSLALFSCVDIK